MKPVAKMVGETSPEMGVEKRKIFGIILERKREKMNSKNLRKRLEKMDYTLGKDIFGWIVISNWSKFEWRFPTLGGVNRFITDEENMAKYAEKNRA